MYRFWSHFTDHTKVKEKTGCCQTKLTTVFNRDSHHEGFFPGPKPQVPSYALSPLEKKLGCAGAYTQVAQRRLLAILRPFPPPETCDHPSLFLG